MRVISGTLKGKTISFLKSNKTRPLKDSVKENIFNIIIHSNILKIKIERSRILDLYSGIGSFGVECISRGAKNVTFVEKEKFAFQTLLNNLINLGIENKTKLFNESTANFLKKKNNNKYQIFFLDPPFKEKNFLEDLKLIRKKKIFQENHLIIIHREKNSKDAFNEVIEPSLIKIYSRSKIIFGKFLI